MINKKFFVPLVILLILPSLVSATDYYVDNSLSTNGNGLSWSTAWNSFGNINWNSINAGDTLYISGGSSSKTYHETLTVAASGSSTSNMVRIDVGANSPSPSGHDGMVIIDGSSTRDHAIEISGDDYVQVYGSYGSIYKLLLQNHTYRTIEIVDSSYVYIDYVKINNADSRGVFLQEAQHSRVRGCDIRTGSVSGSSQADGIYMQWGNDNIIEDNVIILGINTPSAHVDCFQSANYESRLIVRGNWFEWTAGRGNEHSHTFIIEDVDDWTYIYNNVMIGSTSGQYVPCLYLKDTWPDSDGIYYIWNNILVGAKTGEGSVWPVLHLGACDNDAIGAIKNNIIVSYDAYPIYSNDELTAGKMDNNLLLRDLGGDVSRIATGRSWAEHQSAGYDPNGLNVDPEYNVGNEYRPLDDTAPTIGAGADISGYFTDDRDQNTRSIPWDIGAYEFQGAISCLGDSNCGYLNDPPCVEYVCISEVCTPTYPSVSCDDGNECTNPDTCSGGSCSGTPITGSCTDDGNECTDDVCSAGACTHPVVDDETSCSGSGHCCNGYCDLTTSNTDYATACRSGPQCVGSSWEYVAASEGIICLGDCQTCTSGYCLDDNGECSGGDVCSDGICIGCTGDGDCDDGVACTDDVCSGGSCSNTPNDNNCLPLPSGCTSGTCELTGCVYEPAGCAFTIFLPGEEVEAEDGVIETPMNISGDGTYVYLGGSTEHVGSVNFTFNIQQAGEYRIEALVNDQNSGEYNSFYVGLDREPAQNNNYYAYDTPIEAGFQWDNVSLRSTGSYSNPGSDPMNWTLSVGLHNFTFWGREVDCWLDKIKLIPLVQTQQYHRADNNPQDCVIDTPEVMAFMQRWRVSIADVGMVEMMDAIEKWKAGTAC